MFPSLLHRLIVLTRGTGQGTSLFASTQHPELPPTHPANSRRLRGNLIARQCKPLEQDPAPRHSTLQPAATTSCASQVCCIFGELFCLSPPYELPRSCTGPAGFICQKESYQLTRTWWTPYVIRWNIRDDAIHSPGTCIFWRKYTDFSLFFIHWIFSIFMEKIPV
jgi:hypothetical protein